MNVLAVDIGNSRVKWCWDTTDNVCSATLVEFSQKYDESSRFAPTASHIVVCSVATPAVTQKILDTFIRHQPHAHIVRFTANSLTPGFTNDYLPPESLGADRWAAALGARRFCGRGGLLIASFGTATTIDFLSPDNHFMGGVILPGVSMMAEALAQGTAQLPRVDFSTATAAVPNNTLAAINEGIIRAQVGALQISHAMAVSVHGTETCIIATGGARHLLERHLPKSVSVVDNLVLHGLLAFASETS